MSLTPSRGARFLLERAGHPVTEPAAPGEPGPVEYHASILLPEARFDFRVEFAPDGTPAIETVVPDGGPATAPPARAAEVLRSIARTVGRHAVAEDPPAWPRRVLRWRNVD